MMVLSFFVAILSDIIRKLIDRKAIRALCVCRPIPRCFFAHDAKGRNGFDNLILDKIVIFPCFFPGSAAHFKELVFELLVLARFVQFPFKIGQERNRTAVAKVFVEHFHKDILDSLFICLGVRGALGVHIEENYIRVVTVGCYVTDLILQFFIRNFHPVQKKTTGRMNCPIVRIYNDLIRENIGKDLQEVRLTASKKARDPDTHLISPAGQSSLIGIKESVHILIQFFCDNVLVQFLIDVLLILLSYFDDPIDLAVNSFMKHFSDFHSLSSCLTE